MIFLWTEHETFFFALKSKTALKIVNCGAELVTILHFYHCHNEQLQNILTMPSILCHQNLSL